MIINILIATGVLVVLAILSAILLALAGEHLKCEDNNQDIEKIENYLPGYNCGVCGYSNCKEVAKKIANGEIKNINVCKVMNKENSDLLKEYCKNNKIEIE